MEVTLDPDWLNQAELFIQVRAVEWFATPASRRRRVSAVSLGRGLKHRATDEAVAACVCPLGIF